MTSRSIVAWLLSRGGKQCRRLISSPSLCPTEQGQRKLKEDFVLFLEANQTAAACATPEEGDASNLENLSRCDISLVGRHARHAFVSRFCLMQDSSVTCVITQPSVIIIRACKLSQSAYFSSMWLEERGGKSRLKKRSRSSELAWWFFCCCCT